MVPLRAGAAIGIAVADEEIPQRHVMSNHFLWPTSALQFGTGLVPLGWEQRFNHLPQVVW
jgi:hypothetical protein